MTRATLETPAAVQHPTMNADATNEAPVRVGSRMKVGISSFGAWMLGVGSMIGSMAWLMHAPMLARSTPVGCMIAWLLAGTLSLPLALILMELSSMFPSAGGPYIYKYYALKRLFPATGELLGFLTGWLFSFAIMVGLACMSNGLANLLCSVVFGSVAASPVWFGPTIILALFGTTTAVNFMSVGKVSKATTFFTMMKFGMAFFFAGLVLTSKHASLDNLWHVANPVANSNLVSSVSSVLMLALAAFSFMEITGCTSAETVDAQKSVPRALFLTLLSVTLIYLCMCFCVSISAPYVLTANKASLVVPGTSIQATCPALAGYLGGSLCGHLFSACAVISIIACGFIAVLGMSRVIYSMAETKLFPRQFSHLDEKTRVPTYALTFQFFAISIIAIAANLLSRSGVFPDAYAFLGDTFGFMYSFIATLYGVCIVSLRYTDPQLARPFKVGRNGGNGLVWLMSAITIAVWGYAAVFCVQWTVQLTGVALVLAGIPVYHFYKQVNRASIVE